MKESFELVRYKGISRSQISISDRNADTTSKKDEKQWSAYVKEQRDLVLGVPNSKEVLISKAKSIQKLIEDVFNESNVPFTKVATQQGEGTHYEFLSEFVDIKPNSYLSWQMGKGVIRLPHEPSLWNDELTYLALEELRGALLRGERLDQAVLDREERIEAARKKREEQTMIAFEKLWVENFLGKRYEGANIKDKEKSIDK